MTGRPWLIDKSALVRLGDCQEQELWAERIGRGLVHVTTITLLEAGFSARSAQDMGELLDRPPLSLMPVESDAICSSPASKDREPTNFRDAAILSVRHDGSSTRRTKSVDCPPGTNGVSFRANQAP